MTPIIYFRDSATPQVEKVAAAKFFETTTIPIFKEGAVVIPRYSLMPFAKDLYSHIKAQKAKLIQSYVDHQYIKSSEYLNDIAQYSPRVWWNLESALKSRYSGPYVVKGETYSRRNLWSTHMFAKDKDALREVYVRLTQDSLIGDNPIIIKEYMPFPKLIDPATANEPPVINEHRIFVYKRKAFEGGYYWSNYFEEADDATGNILYRYTDSAMEWVQKHITPLVKADFYAVDVAFGIKGVPYVIEINDGCCSGLSTINPDSFYKNLRNVLYPQDKK